MSAKFVLERRSRVSRANRLRPGYSLRRAGAELAVVKRQRDGPVDGRSPESEVEFLSSHGVGIPTFHQFCFNNT